MHVAYVARYDLKTVLCMIIILVSELVSILCFYGYKCTHMMYDCFVWFVCYVSRYDLKYTFDHNTFVREGKCIDFLFENMSAHILWMHVLFT